MCMMRKKDIYIARQIDRQIERQIYEGSCKGKEKEVRQKFQMKRQKMGEEREKYFRQIIDIQIDRKKIEIERGYI